MGGMGGLTLMYYSAHAFACMRNLQLPVWARPCSRFTQKGGGGGGSDIQNPSLHPLQLARRDVYIMKTHSSVDVSNHS